MNLKMKLQRWSGKLPGDLEWDSDSGSLSGSLAAEVAAGIDEFKAIGIAPWGAKGCLDYPLTDPLHRREEFALVLDSMGFILPAELAAAYPVPADELLDDPELAAMTPAERSRVVF
jgi:hypothetical protein